MTVSRNQKLNLLRLAVLLIVVLAVIKFSFWDSLIQHKEVNVGSRFWASVKGPKLPTVTLDQPVKQSYLKPVAGASEQEKNKVLRHWDFTSKQMRLVHLDLKGAAPRVSYLEQIFPLFSEMGADGVLIEYEDMFPFQGELEILRSPYAYSEEDIVKIQELAKLNNLDVIPLVQTFGHMEFLLKHNKYQHLREVVTYPNTFNPHLPETLALLKAVLTQVLSKHPLSNWVHIGADEVFLLGKGMDSKKWMKGHAGDVEKIYLNHVREVVNFIVGQPWGLRVLLWDDMLRKAPVKAVQDSGIARYASPVLWFYEPDFNTQVIETYIKNYAMCGFSSVWFASAFKGSTGPDQMWPPLDTHLKNHLQWLKVIEFMKTMPSSIHFQGIVLTGWQRYDHYSTLCELLPVGIPSLAVCLQTLVNGRFDFIAHKKVQTLLGFKNINLKDSTWEGRGVFPGSDVYYLVEQVKQLKNTVSKTLDQESALKGWFSPYHRKHKFGNRLHLEDSYTNVLRVLTQWKSFIEDLRSQMERIYFPDTVDEWMEENVNPHMDRLHKFIQDFKEISLLKDQHKKV